jgi:hypothetical protein
MSSQDTLLDEWSELKAVQLIRWRSNLKQGSALNHFDCNKQKMNAKIRRIFPRGKGFDKLSADLPALLKKHQSPF